ncbi:MAG TPA: family 16 glycoside hydrolase [Steroidobacteraceae bacterium]|jgi:hypothetical protein|nr:family 16 glycoside hydrolase [Steroidobacteraceae bacterium]
MRQFNLRRLLMLGGLLCSPGVFAAGSYTESFQSTPTGWSQDFDSWNANAADYRNVNGVFPGGSGNPVAWYTGRQWTKNFTYKVRAYSDWPDTGNQLGVVFGLTDSTHYFEVLLNMSGDVSVFQVSGNANTPAARGTGSVNPAAARLAVDTWFDLEVFVDGTTVKVKVNGVDANVVNSTIVPVAGYIGFVARNDKARFDDVSVVAQLFRGNFTQDDGTAIDLSAPDFNCTTSASPEFHRACYARFSGVDSSGYQWPPILWLNGADPTQYGGMLHFMSRARGKPDPNVLVDVTDYVGAAIETRPGHVNGAPTHVLHQWLVTRQPAPDGAQPQIPLAIRPRNTFSEQHDLYMRFWLEYPNAFTDDPDDYWQMPWQFVTDGAHVSGNDDDLRVSVIGTRSPAFNGEPCADATDGQWHWIVQADQHGSQPTAPPLWQKCSGTSTVPTGRWFKVEIFLHRATSATANGRVWVAIDGHEVLDFNSNVDSTKALANMYAAGSPISRMNLPQMYGGDVWPRDQYVDDLEIWDGFPGNASAHAP